MPGPAASQPGGFGPGGGRIGTVLVSPFIRGGTVSAVPYNHYSTLATIEDLFGLSKLGQARTVSATFGKDVFTRPGGLTAGDTGAAPSAGSVPAGLGTRQASRRHGHRHQQDQRQQQDQRLAPVQDGCRPGQRAGEHGEGRQAPPADLRALLRRPPGSRTPPR